MCVSVFLPSLSSMQTTSFLNSIIVSWGACVPVLYFSIWSQQHNFMKKVTEQKMCYKNHGREHTNCCVALKSMGLWLSTTQQGWINLKITNVFWFSLLLLSEIFLILRRILQDIIINVCMSSHKVPTMPVTLEWTLIFLADFQKILISNFRKIHLVGSELFHANGHTDMMKLIVNCCNFAKASKNGPLGMENACSHFFRMSISIYCWLCHLNLLHVLWMTLPLLAWV